MYAGGHIGPPALAPERGWGLGGNQVSCRLPKLPSSRFSGDRRKYIEEETGGEGRGGGGGTTQGTRTHERT